MENIYLPEGSLIDTDMNVMYTSSLRMLEKAMYKGKILEGICTVCDCRDMSLHIDLGCCEGIIPREEVQLTCSGGKDIAVITRVGKPCAFKVTSITGGERPRVLLSRRAAQAECMREYVSLLSPGDVVPATVTHLDPFGAFVDVGCGIVSLICVDSISVSRIFHPRDRLFAGQHIYCAVKSVDRESGRMYMSLRELLGTWEENAAAFSPGSCVAGIVRSIEDYGIFVELSPNLAGLAELREGIAPGDVCSVYIKSIIPERMKIKLVIIDSRRSPINPGIKYYIDTQKVRHISHWRYSPEGCLKVIETNFDLPVAPGTL
ncbi:MAG: 30S ribosomal protein S1 [Ruminococcaceae bacterium]|nr:30S ribosomal protein S1 [Oscillospiraceae bacterium]